MQLYFDWTSTNCASSASVVDNFWVPVTTGEQDNVGLVAVDTASTSASWIHLYEARLDYTQQVFAFAIDANTDTESRSGIIYLKFTSVDGGSSDVFGFTVVQSGSSEEPTATISLATNTKSYASDGGSFTDTVSYIGTVTYEKNASWIGISNWKDVSSTVSSFLVTVAENTATAQRIGTVTFTATSGSTTATAALTIAQSAAGSTKVTVKYSTDTVSVGYGSGTVTLEYTVTEGKVYNAAADTHYYELSWARVTSVTSTSDYDGYVTIEYDANTAKSARNGILSAMYDATGNGNWWGYEFNISQAADTTVTDYIPAWKDIYYTFSSTEASYDIYYNGNVIYSGKAVASPNQTAAQVDVSPIISNYLVQKLQFSTTSPFAQVQNGADRTFILKSGDNVLATYHVHNDWSYDTSISYTDSYLHLSDPINGHFDPRMHIYYTGWESSSGSWKTSVISSTGSASVNTWTISGTDTICYNSVPSTTSAIQVNDSEGDEFTPYSMKSCGSAALYYRNRFGGYDSFLIEGNITKKDTFNRSTYSTTFNNNVSTEFGNTAYHKEITTSWTLVTGWLDDDQAARLAMHLLASPEVYFHDFSTGEIVSAVVTNSEAEYKKFRNGKQLIQYSISIDASQYKLFK